MNSITIGRYAPYDSILHRLDPRSKILALIFFMVAVFYSYDDYKITFIIGGILTIIILSLVFISKMPLRQLFSSLKTMWFLVIFLFLINVLIPPATTSQGSSSVAFSIGNFPIYWSSIFQSLKIILRLILMLCLTLILTATTKPLDLTYALEWFMTPLKIIKFPAHEAAMVVSIALRFIPTLIEETQKIMKAQSSRGVDFQHGKISTRLKAIISLIIPLLASAFQLSDELACAMEARGYDPRAKRTRYRKMKWSICDTFIIIFSILILAGVICISSFGFTLVTPHFIPFLCIGCFVLLFMFLFIGYIDSRKRSIN